MIGSTPVYHSVPSNVSRPLEAIFHRQHLGVAFTSEYEKCIGRLSTSDYLWCGDPRTISEVLFYCAQYAHGKEEPKSALLRLDDRPLSMGTVLGSWGSSKEFAKATKAIDKFLLDIGLVGVLHFDSIL